ncbi:MAG: leucine-rich repeat domain-containing protein [Clostridiales bacterium]|nr:leucine-rich repeat domain-containing protein [Clostridiales bacterium]
MAWTIYYRINQAEAEILRCVGTDPALTLPSAIDGHPVTRLGSGCFGGVSPEEAVPGEGMRFLQARPPKATARYNDTLKRVHLPETVRALGERCFASCRALPRLELPRSITELGERVFEGCGSLTHLELPDGIRALPAYAFAECRSLERVKLPPSVETLGRCCFYNCTHLKALDLPDSVTAIGDRMLMNCFALERLSFRIGLNAGALLDEIEGVVRVTARDDQGAVTMVLPEYSYEYDELIPARQFRAVTYGSGGLYRGCFSDRDIDFLLYDTYFYECKRDDPPELAAELALDRLRSPRYLRPGPEAEYWVFLLEHPAVVAQMLLRADDLAGLDFLLSAGKLEREQLDSMLDAAEQAGNVRFVSRLLDAAGGGAVSGADKSFDL